MGRVFYARAPIVLMLKAVLDSILALQVSNLEAAHVLRRLKRCSE